MRHIIYIFLLLLPLLFKAQESNKVVMKPLKDLINEKEPAWGTIVKWKEKATNKVEILPKSRSCADNVLYLSQVTTRSPMGAIIYETGGIYIDNGWVRILGSGCSKISRNIMLWNKQKSYITAGQKPTFLLIADDIIGGFFAVNAGGISKEGIGKVFYLAPDRKKWEPLDMEYSKFIYFCFYGDLNKFYSNYRWKGWENDIKNLKGDEGFFFFPYLYSDQAKDINQLSRKVVSIEELWGFYNK